MGFGIKGFIVLGVVARIDDIRRDVRIQGQQTSKLYSEDNIPGSERIKQSNTFIFYVPSFYNQRQEPSSCLWSHPSVVWTRNLGEIGRESVK